MIHNGQQRPVFGRAEQLDELEAAARTQHIVLCGPPGVGKTTMARALASKLPGTHVWCDLTQARSEEDLVASVTAAVGFDPRPGATTARESARIADTLRSRSTTLIVLDNFDHVAAHTGIVADWGAGTRVVLTSRSPVPLSGAAQITVEPLEEGAAVQMFVACAAAVAPGFSLTNQNEDTIRTLVRRLDRLPLPIELAAARSHVLRPNQILQRMDQRLATLADQRTGRSLVSALQWTFDLLSADEQDCLAQCCVLRGAFTFDDVEAVVRVDGAAVLDLVDRLVAGGWVRSRWDDRIAAPVFEIFESVRDFAMPRLNDEQQTRTEAAYAVHITRWAREAASAVEGAGGIAAFSELVARERVLRWAAVRWIAERRPEGPALVASLEYLILFHSRIVDWVDVVKQSVVLAEEHDLAVAVRLLVLRGQMDLVTRNLPAAEEGLRHAHALARQTNDTRIIALAARALSIALAARDPASAESMLAQALEGARACGDEVLQARSLERLGFVRNRQFRLHEAFEAFEQAHDVLVRVSNPLFFGESLSGMAYVAWRRGDLAAARSSFQQAVAAHAQAGNRTREAGARFNLGNVLHALGQPDEAAFEYDESMRLWKDLALEQYVPAALLRRALLEAEYGDPAHARRQAQSARAEANGRGDRHNVALAEGIVAVTRVAQGREVDRPTLQNTLAAVNMGADPVAVGAHIALLIGTSTDAAMRDHLASRLDELRALAAEADRYVNASLHAIDRIARGLAALASIDHQPASQSQRIGQVRAAEEAAQQPAVRHNAYARVLARWFAQRRAAVLADVDLSAGRRLTVHTECHWFQLDGGEVVDLTSRKPLRLLLRHFVGLALHDRLSGTAVVDLVPIGWPGENVSASAGKNRVYTAIRFLREMGLEEVLVTGERGYQIAPDVTVEMRENQVV